MAWPLGLFALVVVLELLSAAGGDVCVAEALEIPVVCKWICGGDAVAAVGTGVAVGTGAAAGAGGAVGAEGAGGALGAGGADGADGAVAVAVAEAACACGTRRLD